MRKLAFAVSLIGLAFAGSSPSQAEEYRWCAVYGPGAPVCYFKTLEQCRAATIGGGACNQNLSYDPEQSKLGRRQHATRY